MNTSLSRTIARASRPSPLPGRRGTSGTQATPLGRAHGMGAHRRRSASPGSRYAWRPQPIAVDLATRHARRSRRHRRRGGQDARARSLRRVGAARRQPHAHRAAAGRRRSARRPSSRASRRWRRRCSIHARAPRRRRASDAACAGERQAARRHRSGPSSRRSTRTTTSSAYGRLVASGSLAQDALLNAELEARLRDEELASARFAAQAARHEAAMARAALARFGAATSSREGFDVSAPIARHGAARRCAERRSRVSRARRSSSSATRPRSRS